MNFKKKSMSQYSKTCLLAYKFIRLFSLKDLDYEARDLKDFVNDLGSHN